MMHQYYLFFAVHPQQQPLAVFVAFQVSVEAELILFQIFVVGVLEVVLYADEWCTLLYVLFVQCQG